jgi:hypothetical protein
MNSSSRPSRLMPGLPPMSLLSICIEDRLKPCLPMKTRSRTRTGGSLIPRVVRNLPDPGAMDVESAPGIGPTAVTYSYAPDRFHAGSRGFPCSTGSAYSTGGASSNDSTHSKRGERFIWTAAMGTPIVHERLCRSRFRPATGWHPAVSRWPSFICARDAKGTREAAQAAAFLRGMQDLFAAKLTDRHWG